MRPTPEEVFRRLTLGDDALLSAMTGERGTDVVVGRLDERTRALARLATLVALDAPAASYPPSVAAALRAGARVDDLLAMLGCIAPLVGSVRVTAAAPRIALAAGYDAEAALE